MTPRFVVPAEATTAKTRCSPRESIVVETAGEGVAAQAAVVADFDDDEVDVHHLGRLAERRVHVGAHGDRPAAGSAGRVARPFPHGVTGRDERGEVGVGPTLHEGPPGARREAREVHDPPRSAWFSA